MIRAKTWSDHSRLKLINNGYMNIQYFKLLTNLKLKITTGEKKGIVMEIYGEI